MLLKYAFDRGITATGRRKGANLGRDIMNSQTAAKRPEAGPEKQIITGLVERARAAMADFADADQARVDEAVTALAWSIYEPGRARELAELAVVDTGLGNVDSKIIKNTRKTFGCLRDLLRVKTVGVIEEISEKGLVKYAKPVGVVGAVTPSTNPAATPVNKAMFAIKGRNAVIIAPSPAGIGTTTKTVGYMRAELEKIGLPADLVQVLPAPVNKELTQQLMNQCDLVIVTGSQNNVRRAYSSGTPAIGVGAGNVPVIIDETANFADAAKKICASKIFDNSTSCSSENSVIILDSVYEQAMDALKAAGGYRCTAEEKEKVRHNLWVDGHLNRHVIAKDADVLVDVFGLGADAKGHKFFMVEEGDTDPNSQFIDEKLSLVLTVYRAKNMDDVIRQLNVILHVCGLGHSVGIHTKTPEHAPPGSKRRRPGSPRKSMSSGCWSIRRTPLATVVVSTMAWPSRSPWVVAPGPAIRSRIT